MDWGVATSWEKSSKELGLRSWAAGLGPPPVADGGRTPGLVGARSIERSSLSQVLRWALARGRRFAWLVVWLALRGPPPMALGWPIGRPRSESRHCSETEVPVSERELGSPCVVPSVVVPWTALPSVC